MPAALELPEAAAALLADARARTEFKARPFEMFWMPLPPGSTGPRRVLAIGAGSVFFSHVNDAGFWLVKEYFGMTVPQTLKTWSLMETILSVVGLVSVLLLGLVV